VAFEAVKAEIDLLLMEMQNAPEDRHELHLQIVQKLNELKAFGMRCRTIWCGWRRASKRNLPPSKHSRSRKSEAAQA
jgi:hypothetical protein